MAQHNELGKKGEDAGAEFLRQIGHQILARNYRFRRAEIDIISKEGNIIVFSEVKTRRTDFFGYPEESVGKGKRRLMKQAASEYLFQNNIETEVRFDVLSITVQNENLKIHHIKDAFFNENENVSDGKGMQEYNNNEEI